MAEWSLEPKFFQFLQFESNLIFVCISLFFIKDILMVAWFVIWILTWKQNIFVNHSNMLYCPIIFSHSAAVRFVDYNPNNLISHNFSQLALDDGECSSSHLEGSELNKTSTQPILNPSIPGYSTSNVHVKLLNCFSSFISLSTFSFSHFSVFFFCRTWQRTTDSQDPERNG